MKWSTVLSAAETRRSKQHETSGFSLPLLGDSPLAVLAQRERRRMPDCHDRDQNAVSLKIKVWRDTECQGMVPLNIDLVWEPLGDSLDTT